MITRNQFQNGITDLIILLLLSEKDCYVYEMVKNIQRLSEGFLSLSQNTIYTAAYKLENEGKISEYSKTVGKKRTRVYYHIEPSGIEYLGEMRQSYQKVIDGMNLVFAAHEINMADDYDILENWTWLNYNLNFKTSMSNHRRFYLYNKVAAPKAADACSKHTYNFYFSTAH